MDMDMICCWEEYNIIIKNFEKLDWETRVDKLKEIANYGENKNDVENTVRDAIRAHAALCAGLYCLELFLKGKQLYKNDIKICLEFSSEKGNPYANFVLGQLYLEGWIFGIDLKKSICYLEQAVSQNLECSFVALIIAYNKMIRQGNLSQEEKNIIEDRTATLFNRWNEISGMNRVDKL